MQAAETQGEPMAKTTAGLAERAWLRTSEASAYTGLDRVTLWRARKRGEPGCSYEPPHFTLFTTFCASGKKSWKSLAELPKSIATVEPFTSSRTMTLRFLGSR